MHLSLGLPATRGSTADVWALPLCETTTFRSLRLRSSRVGVFLVRLSMDRHQNESGQPNV